MSNFLTRRGISTETLNLFKAKEGRFSGTKSPQGIWYNVVGTDGSNGWRWKRGPQEDGNSFGPKYAWGCEKCYKKSGHNEKIIFMDDGSLGRRITKDASGKLYLVGGDPDTMLAMSLTGNRLPVTALFGEGAVTGLKTAFDVWTLYGINAVYMAADKDATGERSIANVLWMCVINNVSLFVLSWPENAIDGFDLCKFHESNKFDIEKTLLYFTDENNYRLARFDKQRGNKNDFIVNHELVSATLNQEPIRRVAPQNNNPVIPDDAFLQYIYDEVIPRFGSGRKVGRHIRYECAFPELHNHSDKNPSLRVESNRAGLPMIFCSCSAPTSVRGLKKQWMLYADRLGCVPFYPDWCVQRGFAREVAAIKRVSKKYASGKRVETIRAPKSKRRAAAPKRKNK